MRILHLLSQHEVTGAEVYAAQLAAWQLDQGHQVWIVSDTFTTPTEAVFISRPIHSAGLVQRLGNSSFVKGLIKKEGIQIVHAHSRAASKVAILATEGTAAVLVSTVHGRQGWHGRFKRYDVYGPAVIAVCDNLRTHLVDELRLPACKVQVIPNGVAFGSATPPERWPNDRPVLLLAGRTSGPKGELTAAFLERHAAPLLERHPSLELHLAGGPLERLPASGQSALASLQARFGERVRMLGFVNDLPGRIANARAVIGSGRVAMEALAAGTPLYAAGEAGAPGRITLANWQAAAASNFGDVAASRQDTQVPDVDTLVGQLSADLTLPARAYDQPLADAVRRYYALDAVAAQVLEVYKTARMRKLNPGYIPVLMYHKVPLEPIQSQHRVFVTRDTLAAQLKSLKSRGFEAITFADYDRVREGEPGARLPRRPIVLTFDDAYADNYTNAWPLLKQYGFTAVIYALGRADHDHNFWDTPSGEPRQPLMTAAQKQEMAAAGIEFGAHTQNHVDLTTITPLEAYEEIAASRAALQALTGQPVLSFAYPYGRFTEEIKAMAAQAGFKYSVVISAGGLDWEEDRQAIFRIYVFPEDRGFSFWKKTAPWYRIYFRWKRGI